MKFFYCCLELKNRVFLICIILLDILLNSLLIAGAVYSLKKSFNPNTLLFSIITVVYLLLLLWAFVCMDAKSMFRKIVSIIRMVFWVLSLIFGVKTISYCFLLVYYYEGEN